MSNLTTIDNNEIVLEDYLDLEGLDVEFVEGLRDIAFQAMEKINDVDTVVRYLEAIIKNHKSLVDFYSQGIVWSRKQAEKVFLPH